LIDLLHGGGCGAGIEALLGHLKKVLPSVHTKGRGADQAQAEEVRAVADEHPLIEHKKSSDGLDSDGCALACKLPSVQHLQSLVPNAVLGPVSLL